MKLSPLYTRSLVLAPALLALSACNSNEADDGSVTSAEPIAPIAAPAGQQWADKVVETPEGGYAMGNPDAPIKLVEYASTSCNHCADFSADSSAPLRDSYIASGRVSYELRNQVHDPIDLTFAVLSRCAGP
ncbi:MAG: thioredoxin domain-containing protein, partial [Sphingomonadaceae bacterium]